jgi:hypothetical protein
MEPKGRRKRTTSAKTKDERTRFVNDDVVSTGNPISLHSSKS